MFRNPLGLEEKHKIYTSPRYRCQKKHRGTPFDLALQMKTMALPASATIGRHFKVYPR
jgi:hypothetical protein